MDRRDFVKTGVAASVAVTLPATVAAEPAKKQPRPNVLYVFSDQHRAASLPGEPYSEVQAPTLAAFRKANFSMDTCITNYPLCTPYRGILMTGRYPQQSGLINNGLQMNVSERTLSRTFKAAGYHTGYVGKWHLGHDEQFTPPGPMRFDIDYYHVWGRTNGHYAGVTFNPDTGKQLSVSGWAPVEMSDQAITFLKDRATATDGQPFFMMLSYNPPHPPFDPPAADQAPYSGKLQDRPNVRQGMGAAKSSESLHKAHQGYYGGITGIDAEFARLLKVLDDTGLASNTIVIYTADHGEMMGSHGRMSKQVPFEESCRVPFMVRTPGGKAGKSSTMFAAIDIYPTVCGLAGVTVPSHCEGRDHSAHIHGNKMALNDIVFLMNGPGSTPSKGVAVHDDSSSEDGDAGDTGQATAGLAPDIRAGAAGKGGGGKPGGKGGKARGGSPQAAQRSEEAIAFDAAGSHGGPIGVCPNYRGCRTNQYTYAVTEQGRWLLFDNVKDPYQMNNLVADAAFASVREGLDAKIRAWMDHAGDGFVWPKLSA